MEKNNNQNLTDALERIRENNDENSRMWLLYNLINADFIVPISLDVIPDENGNLPENANIKYFSIKNPQGKIYFVVFSNVDYFKEWKTDILKYHAKYTYKQVEKIVTRESSGFAGFVIDPNHSNVYFENELLKNITKSLPSDMAVQADKIITENNMGLVPAVNPPEKLIKALIEYMEKDNSIKSAHMMQTIRRGETVPTLIIVVNFLGSIQRVFESLARVAQNNMDRPQPIGMMSAYDKIAAAAILNVKPFYKK